VFFYLLKPASIFSGKILISDKNTEMANTTFARKA
tara:strand:+ start:546 stop:650 length:105 start_codon:yes stop_codon:yes gene_type:complete